MTASPNRIIGTLFGVLYLLFGFFGFFWVPGVPFAGPGDGGNAVFAAFGVNPLHVLLMLVIGAALLVSATSSAFAAKRANTLFGAIFLLLGVVGFFLAAPDGGRNAVNFLALTFGDQLLHLITGVILLATGLGAERGLRPAPAYQVAA